MQVSVKKGIATIKVLQREHDQLESVVEIAETIASQTHAAAGPAKKILEGINELVALLPREVKAEGDKSAA